MMNNIIQNPINHYGMTKSFIYYRNSTEHCTFLLQWLLLRCTFIICQQYHCFLLINLQNTHPVTAIFDFTYKIKTIAIEMLTIKKNDR